MPNYLDTDRSVFNLFANQTVPRFYLIDENGVVVWMCENGFGYGAFTQEKGGLFNVLIRERLNF